MTLRHMVLFRFTNEATDEQIAALHAGIASLPEAIPEIGTFHHGPDAKVNDTSWDYAVVGDFDSVEAYETYRDDPFHREVIRERIYPIVAERASVQLMLD